MLPVKSTSVGSDLKRRIVKKQQGGVASYINVNEPVLQYNNNGWIPMQDAFSEYNLPTKIKPHNEEPLPIAIKAVDTKEERAKADSERKPVKQNAFINGLRPIIEQTLKRRGLDTKWTDHLVAQAALESGWGKSESGKFNLSGIKGKGSEKNTKEYINGKMVNTRDSFRDYKDYNDWADNYINLLSNKRYGKAWTLSEDQFMPYIINAGYATDPNYINKYNKVLAEVKKYEDGGRIRRFEDGGKKSLKNNIKTDNYVAHTSGWGWWNSLKNLGDGKNHVTFSKREDLIPLDVNNEKQYLLNWYQNENTLKRVKNLTGERIPESLRRGTFINMNSNAYLQEKEDSQLKASGGSYFMHGIGYNPEGRNYIVFNRENSKDSGLKIHEINHAYGNLHTDLFNGLKKYRPSQGLLNWQIINRIGADPNYLLDPTEIHSRLMEVRKYLGKEPGETITKEELDSAIKGLDGDNYDRFIGIYDPDAFLYWINTIAYNEPQNRDTIQYAKIGNKLIKKRF